MRAETGAVAQATSTLFVFGVLNSNSKEHPLPFPMGSPSWFSKLLFGIGGRGEGVME